MRPRFTSPRPTNRLARTAALRHCRPVVERLERRLLLAADLLLFIEDFWDDYNPALRSLDQADADPSTPPDRLLIQHQISARAWSLEPNGLVAPGSTFQPSTPFSLAILGPGSDRITLPPTGAPGGLAAGEEVTAVAIGYAGLGFIRVFGNNGIKTININGAP